MPPVSLTFESWFISGNWVVTMRWPTAALAIALTVLNRRGDGQRLR